MVVAEWTREETVIIFKKALVVGIDKYPDAPLCCCEKDAEDVTRLLEQNGDGSRNFDVKLRTDITEKGDLYGELKGLFTGAADVALFYFSGHGCEDGRIVTPDYAANDAGVSMRDILQLANQSACKNRIIILDSCFAGQMGEGLPTSGGETILSNGVTVMAACSRSEVSVECGGHGLFTGLLLQALEGRAADVLGHITPASIYAFIDQSLGAWQQRPLFKTNISHFITIRDVEPKVSKQSLHHLSDYFRAEDDEFALNPSFEFTNTPSVNHQVIVPYADPKKVEQFKELQKYQSVGLVEPVGADHMYFAAMESKACRLTSLGKHYWRLSKDRRF